jgi:hypothetical protein
VLGPDALRLERLLAPASISLMRTDRHLGDAPEQPSGRHIGAGPRDGDVRFGRALCLHVRAPIRVSLA